jgi:four helix bundle protein
MSENESAKPINRYQGEFSQPYHQVTAWKKSDEFVHLAYKMSRSFPPEEKFGLTSQLRRAAMSMVLNIIEGQARKTTREYLRFLHIARASAAECSYLVWFAHQQGFISHELYIEVERIRRRAHFSINQLIRSLQSR